MMSQLSCCAIAQRKRAAARPRVIKTDMTAGVTDKCDKLIAGGLNIQPRWGYTPPDTRLSVKRGRVGP
jgi:hypothetical protein